MIKDNIKIEGYRLKFYEWWKNSIFFFPFLSNYHDEKKVCVYIYIYKFLLIEYTKFNYLKKEKKAI